MSFRPLCSVFSPLVFVCFACFAVLIGLAPPVRAQAAQGMGMSALGSLPIPRGGKIVHFSSNDPKGGNDDWRRVEPGQTFTLVDQKGAGVVRRWWIAISPHDNLQLQRQVIVRCYWDGETEPSVECPINDFFGMGFGERRDFTSLPLNMNSGGTNCYWPMPFHKSARITIENRAKIPIDNFYYNIDVDMQPRLPRSALYFHAQFRRSRTEKGKPVTVLETTGKGQYVGTLLEMQRVRGRGLGYLEGDEYIYVDGEEQASIRGTGSEDYFNSGWYFERGVYSAPYHGVTIKDEMLSRISAYRWHIEDAIPFTRSFRFTMEHGGQNDAPDVDYCSVAYWYQTHPHPHFPALPADLMPVTPAPATHFPGIIEGESLVATAKATEGGVAAQDVGDPPDTWSGDAHLFWMPKTPGAKLALKLNAPETKEYELVGYFTQATDYGQYRIRVNGRTLRDFDGYSPGVKASGPLSLGRVTLKSGANDIELEITGKDARSTGYYVGVDGFLLKP